MCRNRPGLTNQGNLFTVYGQTIKGRSIKARKGFQLLKPARLLKGLGIELKRMQGSKATGTATILLLERLRMRGAIRTQEKSLMTAGSRLQQRLPMHFTL